MTRYTLMAIGVWLLTGWFRPTMLMAQVRPSIEIGGGYAALVDSQLPKTTPVAWVASVAWSMTDSVNLVGEVSGQNTHSFYNTSEYYTFTEPCNGIPNIPIGTPCPPGGTIRVTRGRSGDQDVNMQTGLIGFRFVRRSWRLRPFAHALLGVSRVTWDVTLEELPADAVPVPSSSRPSNASGANVPGTTHNTSTVLQVGAGFDVPIWKQLSARFAADGRRLLNEPRFKRQFRLSAHLILALGG
jgi:hypothetical protein